MYGIQLLKFSIATFVFVFNYTIFYLLPQELYFPMSLYKIFNVTTLKTYCHL